MIHESEIYSALRPNLNIVGLVGVDGSGKSHAMPMVKSRFAQSLDFHGTHYEDWDDGRLTDIGLRIQPDTPAERNFYLTCAVGFYAYLRPLAESTPIVVDSEPITKWLMWEVLQGETLAKATESIVYGLVARAQGLMPGRLIYVHRSGDLDTQADTIWQYFESHPNPSSADPKSRPDVVAQLQAFAQVHGLLEEWRDRGLVQLEERVG